MSFAKCLLPILALFLFLPQARSSDECQTFLIKPFLEEAGAAAMGHPDLFRDSLLRSAPFREFAAARQQVPLDSLPLKDQLELLSQYLSGFFQGLAGEQLEQMQSNELEASLRTHGLSVTDGQGRQALEMLSHANLAREVGRFPYTSSPEKPEMREAEELISEIKLLFVHNTRNEQYASATPILSTRQFLKMGAATGGANTFPFNRVFLQSDNNVFFHTHFMMTGINKADLSSGYGDVSLVLNNDYARRAGWISAYIMNASDLNGFSSNRAADLEAQLQKEFPGASITEGFSASAAEGKQAIARAVRHRLHLLDFTVSDFEILIRNHLLFQLDGLRRTDPAQFRATLDAFKRARGNHIEVKKLVHTWVVNGGNAFQFPARFELKVPVAVPPGMIKVIKTPWFIKTFRNLRDRLGLNR